MNFSYAFPKNPALLTRLFAIIKDIQPNNVTYNKGCLFVEKNKLIADEKVTENIMIHWIDACLMILDELLEGDYEPEDVDEFGHCLLKAMDDSYCKKTKTPEKHLYHMYRKAKRQTTTLISPEIID